MNQASRMLIGKEIAKTDGEVNDTVDIFCFYWRNQVDGRLGMDATRSERVCRDFTLGVGFGVNIYGPRPDRSDDRRPYRRWFSESW